MARTGGRKKREEVFITYFRYVNKRGEGVSCLNPPAYNRRRARVRVKTAWTDGDNVSLYKGEALDDSLIKFLKQNADPRNQDIYFKQGDIFVDPGNSIVARPSERSYVGGYRAQVAGMGR